LVFDRLRPTLSTSPTPGCDQSKQANDEEGGETQPANPPSAGLDGRKSSAEGKGDGEDEEQVFEREKSGLHNGDILPHRLGRLFSEIFGQFLTTEITDSTGKK
jgi:hypothetical protein